MDSNAQDWEQLSFMPKQTPTAPRCSNDIGPESPTSGMSEMSQAPESRPLIFSREAFLASPYQVPGNDWPSETPDGCGPSSNGSLKSSGRRSSSRKTCPVSAEGDLTSCSEDLPISGMTRSGFVYRLRPWERRISGRGSLQLPTPRSQNGEERNSRAWVRPLDQPQNLENFVGRYPRTGMGPTPTARLGTQGGPQAKRYLDPKRSNDLDDAVAYQEEKPGQLNPTWVEWLMGFPIGWTDLDPSETP